MRWLRLVVAAPAVLGLAACGQGADPAAPGEAPSPPAWGDREPVVYSVVVAEVLDDLGTPPAVVFVVDGVCARAGQVEPTELACEGPMPAEGKQTLEDLLQRYARVEFVVDAEAAVGEDGAVQQGGLLFWFGPLKDRKGGEVRVGANYARELTGPSLGVNLALEDQAGSWVVTGAAGLGGCPA